jgi:hypothetical protein
MTTVPIETSSAGRALGLASGESRRRRSEAMARIIEATRRAEQIAPDATDNDVLEHAAALLEDVAEEVPSGGT